MLFSSFVLTFYRGGWCPYCNTQLAGLRKAEKKLINLGFDVYFISPDKHEFLVSTLKDKELQKELNQENKLDFEVTETKGILVVRVVSNSPAADAGFQPGDIILKVGGQSVETATDVQEQVELSSIGKILNIEVIRQGNPHPETLVVYPESFPINN